ncbi:aminotransferase class IV [Pontibacter mangrovi]|uniref:aminotransferase class IV n=1 Tax=Pontibacter mangrovi TaxID=2589816 RepID=UPI0015E2EA31|nr:aminotransferase class IV [Pontibacter mangrovi]
MFILYNNRLVPEEEIRLPLTDRAFQYNDGFFETAIIHEGRLRFWQNHRQRMQEAALALQLELPSYILSPAFEEHLLQLAEQEKAHGAGRLKLKVWRAGAGLYTPQTHQVNVLATVAPIVALPSRKPLQIGICKAAHTSYTPLSHFKGPNGPLYVLAAHEKSINQLDDMLLLSQAGMVAELTSSNIFWVQNQVLCTPALETGCINGIARRNILRYAQQQMQVQEVMLSPDHLLKADAVFAANVTGIRGIESIEGQPISQQEEFVQQLRLSLGL